MTKEEVRHNLYGYLEKRLGELTKEDRKIIKNAILDHEIAEYKSGIKTRNQIDFLRGRISHYLAKAKKLPTTPRIEGNIEALELCDKWLSE